MIDLVVSNGNSGELVFARDGKVFVDSRTVAEKFDKEHKNVTRDIRDIIYKDQEVGVNALNFEPVEYIDQKGERRLAYVMDRDGFMLLVMSFTGIPAHAWKRKFVEAFNRMEQRLREELAKPKPPSLETINTSLSHIERLSRTGDLQLAQMFKALLANEILRQIQNSPVLPGETPMQLEGAVDIAIRLGFRVSPALEGELGKYVKKRCVDLLQGKNNRVSVLTGKQVPANMYPASHPRVEAAVREFFGQDDSNVLPFKG